MIKKAQKMFEMATEAFKSFQMLMLMHLKAVEKL